MTATNQKQEIVQSLSRLDAFQAEKVLHFIKGLVHNETHDLYHQHMKRKAMNEIGHALRERSHSF
jgi:hypothetical protein